MPRGVKDFFEREWSPLAIATARGDLQKFSGLAVPGSEESRRHPRLVCSRALLSRPSGFLESTNAYSRGTIRTAHLPHARPHWMLGGPPDDRVHTAL